MPHEPRPVTVAETRALGPGWIREHSDGELVVSTHGIVAPGKITLDMGTIEPDRHRVSMDLMVRDGGEIAVSLTGASLNVLVDPDDPEVAHITLLSGEEIRLDFRTRPDASEWSRDPDEAKRIRREFEESPGWTERWIRLGYDLRGDCIQFRFQGRFVGEPEIEPTGGNPRISLPVGALIRNISVTPLDELDGGYHPLEISPYFNSSIAGNAQLPRGLVEIRETPFLLENREGEHDGVNLGRMGYRGRYPYIFEDSLCMDGKRTLLRVPKGYYDRLHLLCTVTPGESGVPLASARMIKTGLGHAVTADFGPIRADGKIHHVQVELSPGAFQEFLEDEEHFLEIDLTRRVGLDDQLFPHPAGPPSSIVVHGATLEEAPASMVVRWEGGVPLFERPSVPRVGVVLKNRRSRDLDISLRMTVTGPYGDISVREEAMSLKSRKNLVLSRELPQDVMGKFDLEIRIESEGGRSMVHRTSFALLPPDTRRATAESPFGMWCFFEGHRGLPPGRPAPILKMAGARWTLPNSLLLGDEEQKRKRLQAVREHLIDLDCGHVCCLGNSCCEDPGNPEEMVGKMKEFPPIRSWMVFWETYLSTRHQRAFPNELLGRPVEPLTDRERGHLNNCWKTGTEYGSLVRDEFPDVKLVFGNGYPSFIGSMMARGYPREYLDAFGLDFDLFTSVPERQPGALFAPFSNIFILRSLQRFYGYEEYPIYLTEAIYAPVGEGWLTEREQADHYVRSHLLAMASGVVFFGMCTSPYDPGDEYFYSHYGPIGLLRRPPGLEPRESFCAYSTMTRVLDSARFDGVVATGSSTLYALRFVRNTGEIVHALWTVRGSRMAVLRGDMAGVTITDMFGNRRDLDAVDGAVKIEVVTSPIYLEGASGIDGIEPVENKTCFEGKAIRIADFEHASDWVESPGTREELEALRPDVPYFVGGIETRVVSPREGISSLLEVGPAKPPRNHPHEIPYLLVRYLGGDGKIPADSLYMGARVFGNSSWGRVLFLLEDFNGNSWLSVRGDTSIDFDGWNIVQVRLPHGPDANSVVRTGFESWVSGTDLDPVYPMQLVGLVLEVRSHVIYVDQLRPVGEGKYLIEEIFVKKD